MRKLFLLAGLCAMIISACSTDESDETEQRQAQIREQIVGVWRNGDYWVSFSEDGFMGAFLLSEKETLLSDDYAMVGDTITTKDEHGEVRFAIERITNDSLFLTGIYDKSYLIGSWYAVNDTSRISFSFKKTADKPCKRDHELIGKTFSYIGHNLKYSQPNDPRTSVEAEVVCNVFSPHDMRRAFTTDVNQYWGWGDFRDYYVYLPPKLYFHEHNYSPIFHATTENETGVLYVSFDENGNIICSEDME